MHDPLRRPQFSSREDFATYRFILHLPAPSQTYTLSLHDALPISYPTTKIRVNATCRKCPHKVHRMEMKTAISCTILRQDRKSGSAGMPRPNSYAVFCLKKKTSSHVATSWGISKGWCVARRIGAGTRNCCLLPA